jgi:hypothetical protein
MRKKKEAALVATPNLDRAETVQNAFKLRTTGEIEYLGSMIQTILQHKEKFPEVTEEDFIRMNAAIQVLYWVVQEPSIPNLIEETEMALRNHGFVIRGMVSYKN